MQPELTVVIPTRDRRQLLLSCLESLARQAAPPGSFEVVVVLDGEDASSEEALGRLGAPFALRVLAQPQRGAAPARNRGAQEARAPLLLFLDDDVVADARLVGEHLRLQRDRGDVVGIGRIDKRLPKRSRRWQRVRAADWEGHYRRLAEREVTWADCYAGNLCLPSASFRAAGGFAEDLEVGHDVELGYRLHQGGSSFAHVPEAVVTEEHGETLRHFVEDAERRGRAGWQWHQRHPELLPRSVLGGAREPSWPWVLLRRTLLAVRFPPLLLAALGWLVPSTSGISRWYRFVYGYCYWCGLRDASDPEIWRRAQRGTAILMYHAVGSHGERGSRYVVPEKRFRRQMAWLARRGYKVIALDELVRYRLEHRLPPARSVVLTFDDGYVDNRELALPVLEHFGFPATIFLVAGADGTADWATAPELKGRRVMTPSDARALVGRLQLGSHSMTHQRLRALQPAELEDEVRGSRHVLEDALGVPVSTFAYPFGVSGEAERAAVGRAGFLAACGISPGRNRPATDSYDLRRLEVRGSDSLLRFAATLWLGDTRRSFGRRRRSR